MAGKKKSSKEADSPSPGKVRATFYIDRELFASLKALVNRLQGEAIERGDLGRTKNQSELVEEGIKLVLKKYKFEKGGDN